MARMIYDYTKKSIERVSNDKDRFYRELRKAMKSLMPYELEKLFNWLLYFTSDKPYLNDYVLLFEAHKDKNKII
jgi:hypothetical protein